MNDPRRMLVWMGGFLAVVLIGCGFLYAPLGAAFAANRGFNGLILFVLLAGVVLNVMHVVALGPATVWIGRMRVGMPAGEAPQLLASMARILSGRERDDFRMSTTAMRVLLDGIRMRLDESRDISHYIVGLLIFLGLLGTFWGLLDTVRGVAGIVSGLSGGAGDASAAFEVLKKNLSAPISGMGTAFSSSLFGLAGALVLGVLDLQAGHAQNRFFADLEDWLARRTHLPSGKLGAEGEGSLPSYIEALLEQTADSLNQLTRLLTRNDEERRAAQAGLNALTERLAELSDQLRGEQKLILTLAKNQTDLQPAMAQLAQQVSAALTGHDEMRSHVRSVDLSITRLLEQVSAAREQLPDELRREIRLLAQTVGRERG